MVHISWRTPRKHMIEDGAMLIGVPVLGNIVLPNNQQTTPRAVWGETSLKVQWENMASLIS